MLSWPKAFCRGAVRNCKAVDSSGVPADGKLYRSFGAAGRVRILGSSDFVEAIQREIDTPQQTDGRPPKVTLQQVIDLVYQAVGASVQELQAGGRRAAVSHARAGVAYLWIEHLGRSGPVLARMVGIHAATIYRVARRGRREAPRWEKLLDHL